MVVKDDNSVGSDYNSIVKNHFVGTGYSLAASQQFCPGGDRRAVGDMFVDVEVNEFDRIT